MTRTALYGTTHAGPLVQDTRHWRVRASTDGSLVVHEPGGTERVIASPGQVARVVLVPATQLSRRLLGFGSRRLASSDVVSLLGDDTVLLTIPLSQIRLGSMEGDPRATSGAADVALTLGLALEPATSAGTQRVNSAPDALTRGTTTDSLLRIRRWHLSTFVLLVVMFVSLFVFSGTDFELAVVITTAALLPLYFLAVEVWRRTSLFVDQAPPAPGDRVVVPNVAGPDRWRWLRESQLQIGRGDIVHTRHAYETWVPGPARGGVVRCAVSDDAIWFFDRHDTFLTVVPAELWVPRGDAPRALERACTEAGIAFTVHEGLDLPPFQVAALDPVVYASNQALRYSISQHLDRGAIFWGAGIFVAMFSLLTTGIGLASAFALGDLSTPYRVVALVTAVVALPASIAMGIAELQAKRWDRRQMETLT